MSVPSNVQSILNLFTNAMTAFDSRRSGNISLMEPKNIYDANKAKLKASLKEVESKLSEPQLCFQDLELSKGSVND